LKMKLTPKSEIENRIARLQAELVEQELDGTIIILNSDMFYFTGTVQKSYLYVPAEGKPVLMIIKSLQRGQAESPLENIVAIKKPAEMVDILSSFGYTRLKKIGLELDVLPFNLYCKLQLFFPGVQFFDISPSIKTVRSLKSPYEIDLLSESLQVMDEAHRAVPVFLQEGMREIELAALFESEMRKRGYSGCCDMRSFNQEVFLGNTVSGTNGSIPSFFDSAVGGTGVSVSHPQGAGWKRIKRNEVIYIDYTCVVHGYSGDQTRIYCIGELTPKMVRAYEDSLIIESEIVNSIKPGTPAEAPYLLAAKMAEEMGYSNNFMGLKNEQARFVGHGVGVEMSEPPILAQNIKTPIMPGMTFAIEPKFIFPEGAVGIENTYVMTENGPKCLSITPNSIFYCK